MKRWKKALSAFVVAAVMGISMAAVGCGNDPKPEPGPGGEVVHDSTHNSWSDWKDDTVAGDHYKECLVNGCTKVEREAHVYDNDDDAECNKCPHTREVGGGPVEGSSVVINIADLYTGVGSLADGTELGDGVKLVGEHSIGSSGGKKPMVNGEAISTATHRLQLAKMSKQGTSGIELTLEANATVLVYANSNGSDVRTLGLYSEFTSSDSVDAITALQTGKIGVHGNDLDTAIFEVAEAGTYYLGTSNTVNIFYMIITYDGITETEAQHVTAKTANCTEAGSSEYYVSNYGRYYTMSGSTKTYISVQEAHENDQAALGHKYKVVEGSVVAASETQEGSAKLVCENDSNHKIDDVVLPVLSSDAYKERPEVGEEGTYKIVKEGAEITFTAIGVAEAAANYTPVLDYPNFTGVSIGNAKPAGNGVYTDGGTAVVESGSLKVGESSNQTKAYIALGTALESGVVKISGSIKVASTNGNWTFFQLLNKEDKELLGFRTDPDKNGWGYRLDASSNTAPTIAANTSADHPFEIILDLDEGKVTIKVDGNTIADEVAYSGSNDFSVGSILLNVNGGRTIYLNSLTIATKA